MQRIPESRLSFVPFLPFRLLLVRACRFIIRDPPRVRVASMRGDPGRSHPPTAGAIYACTHASHRIASVAPIHAYLYVKPRARCITLLIEYRPSHYSEEYCRQSPLAPETLRIMHDIIHCIVERLCTRNEQVICSALRLHRH